MHLKERASSISFLKKPSFLKNENFETNFANIMSFPWGSNPKPPGYNAGAPPVELEKHNVAEYGLEPNLMAYETTVLPLHHSTLFDDFAIDNI